MKASDITKTEPAERSLPKWIPSTGQSETGWPFHEGGLAPALAIGAIGLFRAARAVVIELMRRAMMQIRFGRLDDHAVLEGIQRRASLAWESDRTALLAHPESIRLAIAQLAADHVRVAEIGDAPVGFSVAIISLTGAMELDGLFVDPSFWHQGVGRALMADAVDLALRKKALAIDVTVNPHARGFYAKCGFTELGTGATEFGIACRMHLKIRDLQ